MEPGVLGIRRPTLAGIAERLAAAELDAVMAHELSHIRWGDNLTWAIHMAVQVLFQWRFRPAHKDREPVAANATIEVNFR